MALKTRHQLTSRKNFKKIKTPVGLGSISTPEKENLSSLTRSCSVKLRRFKSMTSPKSLNDEISPNLGSLSQMTQDNLKECRVELSREETFRAFKSKDLCASVLKESQSFKKKKIKKSKDNNLVCPVCTFKTSIKRSFDSHVKFHVEQYNFSANLEEVCSEGAEPINNCSCILIPEKDDLSDEESDKSTSENEETSETEENKSKKSFVSEDERFSESEENPIKIDKVFTIAEQQKQSSSSPLKKSHYELCFCGFISNIKDIFRNHVKSHYPSESQIRNSSSPILDKKQETVKRKSITPTCKGITSKVNKRKSKAHFKSNDSYSIDDCYACALCIFVTNHEKSLRTHLSKNHKDERKIISKKLFRCYFLDCDFNSLDPKDLIAHQKLHLTPNPYLCFFCKYSTSSSSRLKLHQEKHVRKYRCKACDVVRYSVTNFRIHVNTHTGPKPFSCTFCNHSCAQKHHMRDHVRTHSRKRSFNRLFEETP